ncbi:PREDICTED: F-box/kelch-repeat protein At3g23880-like [Nicotiana attenuata]|nr:PREDICTED: F-box/kelch-repeat protein At3g23880-like [Nicotiana attenuata]
MSRHSRRSPNLSDDLVTAILLKLPVESLLRFKLVNKSWCYQIKSPEFIMLQINESSSDINRQKILLISSKIIPSRGLEYNMLGFTISSTEASSLTVNSQVMSLEPPLPVFSFDFSYPLMSSCNGLLCMIYSHGIVLWNPAIKRYKMIPKPDCYMLRRANINNYESALYGFAYDSVTEDYKVVATLVINAKDCNYVVGMYSVNNRSWRKIGTIPDGYRLFDQNSISLYGTINMMATNSVQENGSSTFNKFAIISLFVGDKKFIVTPVPLEYCGNHMKLSNFANRLCVSMFVEMDFLVCSLEKNGEIGWTWTNVMRVSTLGSLIGNHGHLDDIICVKKNGNILWRKTDGNFLEYNVKKEEVTEFTLSEIPPTADLSILYAESLACLKIPWE